MKIAFIALALSLTAGASAAITTFTCTLEKFPRAPFTFRMEKLGTPQMDFLQDEAEDDYGAVFSTRSRNETIVRMVETLNGQGGDLRVGEDRIRFFGDSAGIDFVYFDLFKNSGYRSGFVRLNFNFSQDQDYSKVTCVLR